MQRTSLPLTIIATFVVLSWTTSAPAYIVVPKEPIPNKVALADLVVVGKITAIDPRIVSARLYAHIDSRTEFVIADVTVSESLLGPRQAKKIRLGFIGFQVKSGQYKPAPAVGQEGCFYAVKHSTEDFYVVPTGGFHDTSGKNFAKELALTRRCANLLTQPEAGLKSSAARDRLLAAYLLVLRYTYTPLRKGGNLEAKPIDAEQSKLILLALAEADWNQAGPEVEVLPQVAVGWLSLGASKGGSSLPKTFPVNNQGDPKAYFAALKQWLRANAGSYRIQQLVPAKLTKD